MHNAGAQMNIAKPARRHRRSEGVALQSHDSLGRHRTNREHLQCRLGVVPGCCLSENQASREYIAGMVKRLPNENQWRLNEEMRLDT